MKVVPVALGARSYEVRIASGLLTQVAEQLAPFSRGRPFVIVTDANVAPHAARLAALLHHGGLASDIITLPAGEATKSWGQLEALTDALLERGIERGDHVIALGGGVIGDLVGFATSILKRGCKFVQIPTTLLAQVDSSVGGKTAINSRAGKNLIGAFHQPSLVLIDPDLLDTLPLRDVRAGYAEVVKYGLIDDLGFFEWCEANGAALLAGDPAAREHAIAHSVAAKARIVAADERETTGVRALLNLGHTFGHAIETEQGYSAPGRDALNHGEAVAVGMVLAAKLSTDLGLADDADRMRLQALLERLGLPVAIPAGLDPQALLGRMRLDKKNVAGRLRLVLWRGMGRAEVAPDVDEAAVLKVLSVR